MDIAATGPITVRITSLASTGLSADGATGVLMVGVDGVPDKRLLVIPVAMLGTLEGELRDLRIQVSARGQSAFVRPLVIDGLEVFADDRYRNIVLILTNPKSKTEQLWAIPDQGAAKLAQMIMRTIALRKRSILIPGG